MNTSAVSHLSPSLTEIVSPLLHWYQQNARDLPWRINTDPYRVLVSEIMLQQTRVEAVKPYFEKFMAAFPSITDLAYAEESFLLKLWEGLGYYQRVRNLQKAARIIVEEYHGTVPADYQLLLKLPGIGEYTAGSVASIAYNIPVPAVDGNVLRVLARLLNCRENVSNNATRKQFRQIILEILPDHCPGKFNQAIMELGATICLPRTGAKCSQCPLAAQCLAHQENCTAELPVKEKKKERKIENRTLLLFLTSGYVLLTQRPSRGLLSKLWEYPNLEGFLSPHEVRAQLSQWELPENLNLLQLPPGKHIFTHLEWHLQAYLLYTPKFEPPAGFQWISLSDINQHYALPSAFQFYTSRLAHWNQQFEIS